MELAARFWSKVDKSPGFGPNGDCWRWTGAVDSDGYGRLRVGKSTRPAHVVGWELENGPMPAGMVGCHACDTPGCARPDHVFAGTHTDNAQDRKAKGRQASKSGEANGRALLSEEQARSIRTSSLTRREAAAVYNVAAVTIKKIRSGKLWSLVP